jgi:hypothetical protein
MRLLPVLLVAISFGLPLPGPARANELFQAGPIDEVSVRTLPAFTVIETDVTGSLGTAWNKGFRLGARYAALAHSNLNTPTILTFPDWEKNPTAEGNKVHLLVQIMLDPLPDLPKVQDADAKLEQMPSMTVACYAQRGAYSPANFLLGLQKIEEHLKAQGIPVVGPPRYLYYTDTTWVMASWRVGEVQVPIAAGGGRN